MKASLVDPPAELQPKLDALVTAGSKLILDAEATGSLALDDVLGLVEATLDCVEVAAPGVASRFDEIRGAIRIWRSYGPGGPFAPVGPYVPGPGSYRGR